MRGAKKEQPAEPATSPPASTLLPSASIQRDPEAKWAGHRRRKPVHGHKARVAADQDAILPEAPEDTCGDIACSGSKPEAAIRARGGTPRVVHTGTWGGAEALARLRAHNAGVHHGRARIEKVFGTAKRSHGLRWMCWFGLAKAGLPVRLTAVAYNLRRNWRLLAAMPV